MWKGGSFRRGEGGREGGGEGERTEVLSIAVVVVAVSVSVLAGGIAVVAVVSCCGSNACQMPVYRRHGTTIVSGGGCVWSTKQGLGSVFLRGGVDSGMGIHHSLIHRQHASILWTRPQQCSYK